MIGAETACLAGRLRHPFGSIVASMIGLGTWQTFDVSPSRYASLEDVLRTFVELGGTFIDSSPMYGRAEQAVGDLAERLGVLDRLFLATKVWTSGRERGIAQMEESLRRLRRVDLMQVHNLVDAATHLDTLRGWKREGRVKFIGITHYTASAYAEVERVLRGEEVDYLQINYSVAEREAEKRILPLAMEKNVRVIANRPFAEGALLRRLSSRALPDFANEIGCTTWSQLLLKFVISHPAVSVAIPATSNVEHLRDNMAARGEPMPDEEMRRRIGAALAG